MRVLILIIHIINLAMQTLAVQTLAIITTLQTIVISRSFSIQLPLQTLAAEVHRILHAFYGVLDAGDHVLGAGN